MNQDDFILRERWETEIHKGGRWGPKFTRTYLREPDGRPVDVAFLDSLRYASEKVREVGRQSNDFSFLEAEDLPIWDHYISRAGWPDRFNLFPRWDAFWNRFKR